MRKVLVANRGEIAPRILRSCRALALGTVAVYSDADVAATHAAEADEAHRIDPPPPRQSYLDIANVLAAARDSEADGIHPGYAFLSENAEFAERVIAAGLTWVGPTPESIRRMGDKQEAREIARPSASRSISQARGPARG